MANRRDFIRQASLLVAGGVIGSSVLSGCGGSAPKKHIGLQLYSLRDDVSELGIQKVLEIVAQMGYVNLETAGYSNGKIYDLAPAEFKKIVEDLGMKATSAHLVREITDNHSEDMAWWSRATEAFAAAGMKYMIMPWAPFDGKGATLDNVKRYSEYFNEIGMKSAGFKIEFGYHNHEFEFTNRIDGVPVYDLLLEYTNPNHVIFENDVYWTKVGGYNAVDYLKKYPQRHKLLHIKDEKAIGSSGTIDFKPIFDQFYANGMKDWYVEVEKYDGTPQEDVEKSYDFLADAKYVK